VAYAVSMSGPNGCWQVDLDRNGFLTASAILNCGYVKPSGVTHSNPYPTVGPGQHEADRDSGTHGNMAVLERATP